MIWFVAAFLLLTVPFLITTVFQLSHWMSRNGTGGLSVVALALLMMPSIAALAIPLALLLGLTIGLQRSTNESARLHRSSRFIRIVAALVLPACLLETVLLLRIVPAANHQVRTALFLGMAGRDSESATLPKGVREMSVMELQQAADSKPGPFHDDRSATFELHKRAAMPVAGLFLAFLGMALGASPRLRPPLLKLMLAAAAGASWYALLEIGASMVPTGQIPVWFGAWLPAIAACFLAMLAWWWYGARRVDA